MYNELSDGTDVPRKEDNYTPLRPTGILSPLIFSFTAFTGREEYAEG